MTTRIRKPMCASLAVLILALPLTLVACDQVESKKKTTTTTTTQTPEGTKKTTETTEKKVETNPK